MAVAIAGAASTALSTYQQVQEANAAADAESANAAVQDQNARLARQKALAREVAVRRENRRGLALQRAAMAETGLAATGSAALDLETSTMAGELDALLTRYEGELAGRGFAYDAEVARTRRKQIRQTVPLTIASGALGVGAQALSGYGAYQLYAPASAPPLTTRGYQPALASGRGLGAY